MRICGVARPPDRSTVLQSFRSGHSRWSRVAGTVCVAVALGGVGEAQPEGPPPAATAPRVAPRGWPEAPPLRPQPAGRVVPGSLADLLARAEATYPSLAAAREARRQAEARAVAAGALPAVMLNAGAHIGSDAAGDDQDLLVTGRLELGGKRRLRIAVARQEVEAARARERQARVELAGRVRTAYVELQAAAAEQRLAAEHLELARDFLRVSLVQFEAGEVAQANVLRAEVEVENAEQALAAAAALTTTRRIALNMLIGAEPEAPLELTEMNLVPDVVPDLESLRERAVSRPDVRAAEAILAAREAAVALAQAGRRPDLTGSAAHGHLFDWPDGNVVRVGVEFPIFDFGLTQANVNAARAAAREQAATVRLLRLQALQEVESAYRLLLAARAQAQRLGGPQLERAARLRDLAALGYREGELSYLELLDAQRTYLATVGQYRRALAAAQAAAAALERAVGPG